MLFSTDQRETWVEFPVRSLIFLQVIPADPQESDTLASYTTLCCTGFFLIYFFGFYSNIYSQSTLYHPNMGFSRINCVLLSWNHETLARILLTFKPCELSFNLVTATENTIIEPQQSLGILTETSNFSIKYSFDIPILVNPEPGFLSSRGTSTGADVAGCVDVYVER